MGKYGICLYPLFDLISPQCSDRQACRMTLLEKAFQSGGYKFAFTTHCSSGSEATVPDKPHGASFHTTRSDSRLANMCYNNSPDTCSADTAAASRPGCQEALAPATDSMSAAARRRRPSDFTVTDLLTSQTMQRLLETQRRLRGSPEGEPSTSPVRSSLQQVSAQIASASRAPAAADDSDLSGSSRPADGAATEVAGRRSSAPQRLGASSTTGKLSTASMQTRPSLLDSTIEAEFEIDSEQEEKETEEDDGVWNSDTREKDEEIKRAEVNK
ncbi:unnamed protein product [Protopolystoma xenopodis]|uniref:Uncharacterized protein n=1 Tax=Protopolystoma xenopodis TaxID=117903 RepID=A0A3S5CJ54_9PLAT|nr:unnamed protein product [Protopolystoma xenopodis]